MKWKARRSSTAVELCTQQFQRRHAGILDVDVLHVGARTLWRKREGSREECVIEGKSDEIKANIIRR